MTPKGVFVVMAGALYATAFAADPPEQPKDVGLVERTSTRLAQIDVTVAGPKGAIEGLTAGDFEVRVNRQLVPHFIVDDLCVARADARAAAAEAAPEAAPDEAPATAPTPARPTQATYLLYFDMPHLTQAGRRTAIDNARDMLPRLLTGGHRATIVVGAADLKTLVPLTSDVKRLDTALAAMVNDMKSFDTYAATEDGRLAEIIHEMDPSDPGRGVRAALALARRYAAEERWRQERDLRRLSMVLGRLSELDAPKAVLYFADTMRQNAGEHYLAFFSGPTLKTANGTPTPDAAAILADSATGALPLDRVMNEAAALGIRFYTIEGQGMSGMNTFTQAKGTHSSGGSQQASLGLNSQRIRDSQATLVSLAAETGGRAFLNGVSSAKMATQILDDMTCLYLLSFDPSGFPQDSPLSVSVTVNRPKVRAIARGRLVIQSDNARLTGRVLSAFASPDMAASSVGIHIGVIPISYDDGKFKARVQVAVPGSPLPSATWDLGASLVSKGTVWQDGSGRIQVTLPNTPVVFEKDMEFSEGDYDLVAVAHELESDTMASKEVHGSWPKIDAELVSLGPIAVSQQLPGGFLRNGVSQTKGAVVVMEGEAVRPDTPMAVISLVCRAKDQKRPLTVVRTLIGESETPVGKTKLDLGKDRCAQVVDLIPPKMLGAGAYRFVIAVSSEGREVSRAERALVVPEKAPPKSAS